MIWNIIVQNNLQDNYFPELGREQARILLKLNCAGQCSSININQLIAGHKFLVSEEIEDLLQIALSVYSADLQVPRDLSADRWSRSFKIFQPVRNPGLWDKIESLLTKTLHFLTGDTWEFEFRLSSAPKPKVMKPTKIKDVMSVCLFSGGLDSLVGALDLVGKDGQVVLVGHYGAGMTGKFQSTLLDQLQKYFSNIYPARFYVQPPKKDGNGEPSMRSRSFLFLTLGVVVWYNVGRENGVPLTVAENGLISLNVPLTHARAGSLSTRTTHPFYIKCYSDLLEALDVSMEIDMPYKFMTKGEMLRDCRQPSELKKTLPLTMSCSHPEVGRYLGTTPGDHCGYCVPCIIRQAAVHHANMKDAAYQVNIISNPPKRSSDRSEDLNAFQISLERFSREELSDHIREVVATGKLLSQHVKAYADVYARGMTEIKKFLTK